jgi:hypothetical protein
MNIQLAIRAHENFSKDLSIRDHRESRENSMVLSDGWSPRTDSET